MNQKKTIVKNGLFCVKILCFESKVKLNPDLIFMLFLLFEGFVQPVRQVLNYYASCFTRLEIQIPFLIITYPTMTFMKSRH